MEELVNIAPPIITAIIIALIAWLVVRRKEQSEIRLIDTQTLNEWRDFERDTSGQLLKLNNAIIEYQGQLLKLNNAIIEYQLRMLKMEEKMNEMKLEYERRIEMYKSQIANLERRIRELENGNDRGKG